MLCARSSLTNVLNVNADSSSSNGTLFLSVSVQHTQHLKDTDCEAGEKEKFIVAQLRFKWTCSTVRIRSFFAFFALKCIQCTVLLRPLHRYYSSVPLFSLLLFYFSPAPEKEPYTRIKLLLLLQAEDASSTAAEAAPIQPGKQCDWSSKKRKRERERQCTSANISSSSSINFSISSKWSSGEQSSRERVGNKCLPWLTGWQWLWQRRLLSKLKLWLWWSLPGSQLSLSLLSSAAATSASNSNLLAAAAAPHHQSGICTCQVKAAAWTRICFILSFVFLYSFTLFQFTTCAALRSSSTSSSAVLHTTFVVQCVSPPKQCTGSGC